MEAPTPTAVNFSNLCQLRFVKGSLRVCNNISGHHFCYVGTFLRGGGFATDQKIYIHTTRQIFVQQMMKLLCRKGSANKVVLPSPSWMNIDLFLSIVRELVE